MSNPRLLIVEDQEDIRELIRLTLDLEGYEVDEAANGDEGLRKVSSFQPQLVLLDVMMPGSLDGFAVCRQIKGSGAHRRTKVVMLTARCQASDREAGRQAGADAYLTKPFSPKQLLEVVHKLL